MFGFGGLNKSSLITDDNAKGAIIEATNTESGITALGGINADAIPGIPKPDTLSNVQKDAISNLFRDDGDYLTLPGTGKERPRSAVYTHTIGMAVCTGGAVGALTGAVANFNGGLIGAGATFERSQYLTMLVRRIRNNAIRFGGFATVMCTTGVFLDWLYSEKTPPPPTEDELVEMQLKGINYELPRVKPLDESTQRWITSVGFMVAAFGMSFPKAFELWRSAKKFENLKQAQSEAGVIEQQFMKLYGRTTNVDTARLPKLLRRVAVCKVVGVMGIAFTLNHLWQKQMKEKVESAVREFSSSIY